MRKLSISKQKELRRLFFKFMLFECVLVLLFSTFLFTSGRVATKNNTYEFSVSPEDFEIAVVPSRYGDSYFFITKEKTYRAYWTPPAAQITSNEYFYPGSSKEVVECLSSEKTLLLTVMNHKVGFSLLNGFYNSIVDLRGEETVYYSIDGFNEDAIEVRMYLIAVFCLIEFVAIITFIFMLWLRFDFTKLKYSFLLHRRNL